MVFIAAATRSPFVHTLEYLYELQPMSWIHIIVTRNWCLCGIFLPVDGYPAQPVSVTSADSCFTIPERERATRSVVTKLAGEIHYIHQVVNKCAGTLLCSKRVDRQDKKELHVHARAQSRTLFVRILVYTW